MSWIDVAIVGGGPAGAATACGLAAARREVVLFESASMPHHKLCGEFLSPEALVHLRRLGVDPSALGAVPIDRLAVVSGHGFGAVPLPFRALSLSRLRLDEAVLDQAAKEGAEVKRGVSVKSAAPLATGWELSLSDGIRVRCRNFVLATGKRALRGIADRRDRGMVGFKIHLRPSAEIARALDGHVALFVLRGGYAGLAPVEGAAVNLCLVLRRNIVAGLAPGWQPLRDRLADLCPSVADWLAGVTPLWPRPLAVVCPAGGYLAPAPAADRLYPVGDRLAHLPPFTGDGLAAALITAALATENIGAGGEPAAYLAAAQARLRPATRRAAILSRLAACRAGRGLLGAAAMHMPAIFAAAARHTRLAALAASQSTTGEISSMRKKGDNPSNESRADF